MESFICKMHYQRRKIFFSAIENINFIEEIWGSRNGKFVTWGDVDLDELYRVYSSKEILIKMKDGSLKKAYG